MRYKSGSPLLANAATRSVILEPAAAMTRSNLVRLLVGRVYFSGTADDYMLIALVRRVLLAHALPSSHSRVIQI